MTELSLQIMLFALAFVSWIGAVNFSVHSFFFVKKLIEAARRQ